MVLGIFVNIYRVDSSCSGNMILTERFGEINFRQILEGNINNCSWTLQSPFSASVALVVRFTIVSIRGGSSNRPRPQESRFPGVRSPGRHGTGGRPGTASSVTLIFPGGMIWRLLIQYFANGIMLLIDIVSKYERCKLISSFSNTHCSRLFYDFLHAEYYFLHVS